MNFIHPSDGIFKIPYYTNTWVWFSKGEVVGTFRSKPKPDQIRSGVHRPEPLDIMTTKRMLSCMTMGLEDKGWDKEKAWEQLEYGSLSYSMIYRNPRNLDRYDQSVFKNQPADVENTKIKLEDPKKESDNFGLAILASLATVFGTSLIKHKKAKAAQKVEQKVEENIQITV